MVLPHERDATSSIVGVARGAASILGPPVTAVLWARCGPGAPFFVAGLVKVNPETDHLTLFSNALTYSNGITHSR